MFINPFRPKHGVPVTVFIFLALITCWISPKVHGFFPIIPDILRINFEVPMQFGFLISIPWTTAIPSINKVTSRRKRNLKSQPTSCQQTTTNCTHEDHITYDDGPYVEELEKMSQYLALLQVDGLVCEERLICEIFANPDLFSPLVDLFQPQLTADHGPYNQSRVSRYFRYTEAMLNGVSDRVPCSSYEGCGYSPKDHLLHHHPTLRLWGWAKRLLKVSIRDTGSRPEVASESSEEESGLLSRVKRQYWNTASPIDCGLEWIVPLTFLLPQFNFAGFLRRKKRDTLKLKGLPLPVAVEESYDQPAYIHEIQKIQTYLAALGIDMDEGCMEKVICELTSEGQEVKYSPLAQLIIPKLKVDRGPLEETNSSRIYRYVRALGLEESCDLAYPHCPIDLQPLLQHPKLHLWNFLAKIFKIQFLDK